MASRHTAFSFQIPGLLLALLFAAACGGGGSGPELLERPILGMCDVAPNYITQVGLNRWRQFPLTVHVMEATFPAVNRDVVLAEILKGLGMWAVATNGSIGSFVGTASPDGADLIVLAEDIGGGAVTTHTGGSPFLHGGRIRFDPVTVSVLANNEDPDDLSAIAAHEMGHLLGIVGHARLDGVLMSIPLEAPQPTTADVNTLSHAYCR